MNLESIIIGLVIGYLANYILKIIKSRKKAEYRKAFVSGIHYILSHLDAFIAILAAMIFTACIIYDYTYENSDISIHYLSIFSTLIFSWLLTKKSTELQCKKEQEKVAALSHRRLSDIEYTALTAEQTIKDYLDMFPELNATAKATLTNATDKILVMRQGIKASKEEWYDLLGKSYQEDLASKEGENKEDQFQKEEIKQNYKTVFQDRIISINAIEDSKM